MKLLVKKHFGKLIPVYHSDAEALRGAKMKEGDIFEGEFKKKRNPEFHKKYFALLNLCFANQESYEEFDDLREELTINAGFFRVVKHPDGRIQKKAISISFANMDNIEFDDLYQKTITEICKMLGCSNKDLLSEVLSYT